MALLLPLPFVGVAEGSKLSAGDAGTNGDLCLQRENDDKQRQNGIRLLSWRYRRSLQRIVGIDFVGGPFARNGKPATSPTLLLLAYSACQDELRRLHGLVGPL